MIERLDEERIEILRAWGAGLGSDPREELRAAGKAITVLIEEIDRLQVDLWKLHMEGSEPGPHVTVAEPELVEIQAPTPAMALLDRLKRAPHPA